MSIKRGNIGFHVSFVVPNDATERMDQFIATHEQFMRETHHLSGDQEPMFPLLILIVLIF